MRECTRTVSGLEDEKKLVKMVNRKLHAHARNRSRETTRDL